MEEEELLLPQPEVLINMDHIFFVQLFGILLLLVVIGITKHTGGASLKEVLSQSVYDLNYLQ